MKITNDQQAQAARKKLDALKEYAEAFRLPFNYSYSSTAGWPEEVVIRSALAAYEQRKAIKDIVLSEDELIVLRYAEMSHAESVQHIQRLKALGLLEYYDNKLIFDATPQGRAYLAALDAKPKRELKWEVHTKSFGLLKDGFLCSCEVMSEAEGVCNALNNHCPDSFEVREVK